MKKENGKENNKSGMNISRCITNAPLNTTSYLIREKLLHKQKHKLQEFGSMIGLFSYAKLNAQDSLKGSRSI